MAATLLTLPTVVLPALGRFLVVNDPLAPADAIIVLAGGVPFREREAAALYRAGLADRVIIVPEQQNREVALRAQPRPTWRASRGRGGEQQNREVALRAQASPTPSDRRRNILIAEGVPPAAVVVVDGAATTTLDELELVARVLPPASRRVILVTSQYHSRRVSLIWQRVAAPQVRGVVHAAPDAAFDPGRWWLYPLAINAVLHEYLGLLDYALGFPGARWLVWRASSP